jgi:hypothetical protein
MPLLTLSRKQPSCAKATNALSRDILCEASCRGELGSQSNGSSLEMFFGVKFPLELSSHEMKKRNVSRSRASSDRGILYFWLLSRALHGDTLDPGDNVHKMARSIFAVSVSDHDTRPGSRRSRSAILKR